MSGAVYSEGERRTIAALAENLGWLAGSLTTRRAAEDRAFAIAMLRSTADVLDRVAAELDLGHDAAAR